MPNLTFNIADLIGADFDPRRTKVWIEANADPIIDTAGHVVHFGDARADVLADGTGSFTGLLATNATGINPSSFLYQVHVDYPLRSGGRDQWKSGWFALTADSDLSLVTPVTPTPPNTTDDAVIASRVSDTGSATTAALAATRAQADRTRRAEFNVADYASVQAAVDAAEAAGGGVVRCLPGANGIAATLNMKSRVILAGPAGEMTVWGYNSTPTAFHTAWLEGDGSTTDPVVRFGTSVVSAGLHNLMVHNSSGRRAIDFPDSTTRGGNRLRNVYANGGGVYVGQREVRIDDLFIMSAPGDGLTVAAQDCDVARAIVGYSGGSGVVLTSTSGPIRMHTLDTFFNALDGLRINGDGHMINTMQANDNQQRGVAFLTATNCRITDLTAANNSRATGATHYADVDFAHPTASNMGCSIIGGKIANDGQGSYAVANHEAVTSYPAVIGVTFGGSYQGGTSPFALVNSLSSFRLRGCLNVPDVIGPQGGVAPLLRPNGTADIVQAGDGSGNVYWGITNIGRVYDKTLGLVQVGDPRVGAALGNFSGANRTLYARVTQGGVQISKVALEVGVSSGNISVAVYRNSGSGRSSVPGARVATSAAVACPAAGYAEVALDTAVTVYPGDWLALSCDNTTATFKRWADATSVALPNLVSGLSCRQDVHPAPTTPASFAFTGMVPCLIGVP